MTTINFNVLPPPPALSRDVECLRIATYLGERPLEIKVCPSGYPGIVFQLAADQNAAIDSIAIRTAEASEIPILKLAIFIATWQALPIYRIGQTSERNS